ncbi:von hippel-lindau-binding protein (macronuclear) [Tetrahymena thermophila SB210]|uniref:Prefoldin subunit 3 n=1 Tax=Tetrahymena thermophila (strain SB210) TaxID=312017 RepID=Q23WQ1_TETTS|nr:von hippel-lindau-binding protein [Tetrahymena thermophila SB210]EAS00929.3 von hippel-lindau-binding protein [Tetrahymena thermophila SB210]|eukprot:XP_001021174.3 von hippel-lindau-binding protein [Tetrahymena thermophila SB210]
MADYPQLTTTDNSQNPRKIPQAIFIENVEQLCSKYQVEKVMEALQETYNKFKMMEMQILKQKESMQQKIPEIEKALEIVSTLEKREDDMTVDFLLTDTIWTKAEVKKEVQKVALWLGANVMVEFSYQEAKELLKKNLENATGNYNTFDEDWNFLKDQITTCEVNIARIYNFNVKKQQETASKKKV